MCTTIVNLNNTSLIRILYQLLLVINQLLGDGSCINLILTNRKYSFKLPTTFEASLCDHHHLMYSILKTTFQKEEQKILICRYFKKFTQTDFQSELISEPNSRNSYEYCSFERRFVEVLDKHTPEKRKFLPGNYKLHVNKTLHSGNPVN